MINLLDLDAAGLEALVADLFEKPFRAKQLSHWVHQRLRADIGAMTDLSRPLRELAAANRRFNDFVREIATLNQLFRRKD